MPCPQCQQENPAAAKFCLHCGTRLALVCAHCQQVLPPAAKFCLACGQALTTPASSASQAVRPALPGAVSVAAPLLEAERRQLTVMFCDLVGSTPLSEQLDPEDLREIVRAYQQTCATVIQRFDGHIAQLLGDALLVYFGWPRAHEDDAQRAMRTGLGMLDAMGTLNARLAHDKGLRLAIRVGIHTGLVVVGAMGGGGHQEQLALGDTPNIAARLQGLAAPDTVVMSEATFRLVEGYCTCEPLGAQTLKGVSHPMPIYRVLGTSGVQSRLEVATSHGLTPLVGREQEVGALLERWTQVQESRGQVIILSGEAGIGKSRLLQVLQEHLAGTPYTRVECRSSPYYHDSALYPLIDLLQRTLHAQVADGTQEQFVTLEQLLGQYHLATAETVPLMAGLLAIALPDGRYPPLTLSPQQQRQKTLEALLALVFAQAAQQPVLFILEDLHWTDPSTLEWLDLLIMQVPTVPLLTLLTCRPEFQPPWGNRSYLTPLALQRFTRVQIETMVLRVTGGKPVPTTVMQHLVEKTDGVPLYVEEMTKAIVESDVLQEAVAAASTHFAQGIALYDSPRWRTSVFSHEVDEGVNCRGRAAWALCCLYLDQGLAQNNEALTLSRQSAHPLTLGFALSCAAIVHQCRREWRVVQECAEAAIHLATERGFPHWNANGLLLRGWALAQQGQAKEGIEQMHQGLKEYRAIGAGSNLSYFLALMAEVYEVMGQPEAGFTMLAEALTFADKTGERWYKPEIHRLKGALLLPVSIDNVAEAETCFHQALTIARRQQAKSLELRAATSLSRPWQQQGKQAEAHELLVPIYGWFTEEFDTADLQEARALLDALE